MNQIDAGQPDGDHDAGPREPVVDLGQAAQDERRVMHPDRDDPDWRYFFGAWQSS